MRLQRRPRPRLQILLLLILLAAPTGSSFGSEPDSLNTGIKAAFPDLLVYRLRRTLLPGEREVALEASFFVPGSESVSVGGERLVPGRDYHLDAELGRLLLAAEWPDQRLELSALRRPLALPRMLSLAPLRAWQDLAANPDAPLGRARTGGGEDEPLPPGSLSMGGSKSLVLRMGSGESVNLEQSLRLSLSGHLTDSTVVEAVLRDDDLPFQPEGNTERLEELDKVYLKVRGPAGSAQVGDFVYEARARELTPFRRDFQGLQGDWRGGSGELSAWLAQSRGLFRSEEFYGEEGLQGPYELLSALRQGGAVILAGSEQVRVNGSLLTRGRDRDYTIDYDLASLTFTTGRPISSGDIVSVDFRYSQENWRRGAWGFGAKREFGALAVDYLQFAENDDRESPLSFTLDDERRAALAAAGDDPDLAITGGVTPRPGEGRYLLTHEEPADPELATYAWVDSLGDYDLRFHELGSGLGDYAAVGVTAAGERIYGYRGAGRGSFALGERLEMPEAYRLSSLRADWGGERIVAETEVAISDRDGNLLSEIGDGDNGGLAVLGKVEAALGEAAGAPLAVELELRRRDKDFHFPGLRSSAQHYRDWNLPWNPGLIEEQQLGALARWGDLGARGVELRAEKLSLGERFDGRRLGLEFASRLRGYSLRAAASGTASSDSLLGDGSRGRGQVTLGTGLPIWRGIVFAGESAGVDRPDSLDFTRPQERRSRFDRRSVELRFGSRGGARPWSLDWQEERIGSEEDEADEQRRLRFAFNGRAPAGGSLSIGGNYQRRRGFVSTEQFQVENRLNWFARPGGWGGEALYRLGSRRQRLRQTRLVFIGFGQGDLNEEGIFVGEGEGDYRRLTVPAEEAVRTQNLEIEARLLREPAAEGEGLARVGSETRVSLHEERRGDSFRDLLLLNAAALQEQGQTLLGFIDASQELRYRLHDMHVRYRLEYSDRLDDRDLSGSREESGLSQQLRLRQSGSEGSFEATALRGRRLRISAEDFGGGNYDVGETELDLSYTRHLRARASGTLGLGLASRRDDSRDLSLREFEIEPLLTLRPLGELRLELSWRLRHSSYPQGDPAGSRPWFFEAPGWDRTLRMEATAQAGANLTLSAGYELREEQGRPRRHRLRMESRAYF